MRAHFSLPPSLSVYFSFVVKFGINFFKTINFVKDSFEYVYGTVLAS
jgi:hypothetical protein